MASTYSNLKIQLMTTGENSGTWGNVTNVNLGTALEEAIVGSADVTFSSADVTLTFTDSNASQAARNLRLNLTGTVAAAQNLIVPAIEKVYAINNGLTFAITVKNASGTGIAVPAGKTMWVYNNGTNVVDVVTHLTSLTLGTPLAVTQGGTGANTTTFCNLQSNVTGILPNANTTAAASNGASTIIARDSSGNFAANTITANLTGLASNATFAVTAGTATNATTAATATNATQIINAGSFNITVSGTKLFFSYNGTTVASLDSSGNFTTIANITAYGAP
jgi:hypothetical protein